MQSKRKAPLRPAGTDFRRKLSSRYQKAEQNWTREMDKLHALFLAQGLAAVARKDLAAVEQRREAVKMLAGTDREEAEYLASCLELHHRRTQELLQQIKKECNGDDIMQRLQSVPGVGPVLALTFASHVASGRFQDRGQVSSYIGLTPDYNMKHGKIKGNDHLRNLMVQAAMTLVRSEDGGKLKERYECLTRDTSKNEMHAVLAIARQMAELLYTLAKDGSRYESSAVPASF